MMLRFCLLLSIFLFAQAAGAGELHLIISGTARHFDDKNFNEKNWGLGFEYDFEQRGNWIPLITGAVFEDSNNDTSKYLGGGAKRRFLFDQKNPDGLHFDVGVVGFLMTRRDYKDNDPFFGALPFVSFGNSRVALNATYVPKIDPKMVSFVYFQAMIKLAEF